MVFEIKQQVAVISSGVAYNERVLYILFGAFISAVIGIFIWVESKIDGLRKEYQAFTAGLNKDNKQFAAELMHHNAEEFERFSDRLELIDQTNIQYDESIKILNNDVTHESEVRERELKDCKERCHDIRCKP